MDIMFQFPFLMPPSGGEMAADLLTAEAAVQWYGLLCKECLRMWCTQRN